MDEERQLTLNQFYHKTRIVFGGAYQNGYCDCVTSGGACHVCGGSPDLLDPTETHAICESCYPQLYGDSTPRVEEVERGPDLPDLDEDEIEALATQLAKLFEEELDG